MPAETQGPSEEDLRIRTEAGEPESRIQDIDRAREAAPHRDTAILRRKLADKYDEDSKRMEDAYGHLPKQDWPRDGSYIPRSIMEKTSSYLRDGAEKADRDAEIAELEPLDTIAGAAHPKAMKLKAEILDEEAKDLQLNGERDLSTEYTKLHERGHQSIQDAEHKRQQASRLREKAELIENESK